MTIILHCDMCGAERSYTHEVIMNLSKWLIIVNKKNKFFEEHFCPDCRKPHDEAARERSRQKEEMEPVDD